MSILAYYPLSVYSERAMVWSRKPVIMTLNLVGILAAMFIHQVNTDEGVVNTIELFLYKIRANSLNS